MNITDYIEALVVSDTASVAECHEAYITARNHGADLWTGQPGRAFDQLYMRLSVLLTDSAHLERCLRIGPEGYDPKLYV